MNILMISNIDDDEKLEDIWLARAFQEDGHKVAIVDENYDERLEEIFDIFILRNSWSSNATIKTIENRNDFSKRIIKKNLARINFDGNFDEKGKGYLVNLFKKGYQVIPSIDKLEDIELLNNPDKYILKLKESYDGIGQMIVDKKYLQEKFSDLYIIQPFMKFVSEVQFYYIKDKFEYALEFKPSKIPVYPKAIEYMYSDKELEIANTFAKLNGDYYGVQRIDFIKLEDGTLLLTEIEDVSPYLDLDCVDEKRKNKFIQDYKDMVYEYIKKKGRIKMEKSKVYFTREITPESVVKMYEALGIKLPGKVAVKVHSGEEGNQNYLHPEFMKPMIEHINGTVVECNTAYEGERNTTEKHQRLMAGHGWSKYFNVDIMDAEGDDLELKIPNGKAIKENYVGKNMANYDSMLVLSHFKGHPMGGYGGALKQLSIGCGSSAGKSWIHSAGKTKDQYILWDNLAEQDKFLEAMADSALSVVNYFKDNIAYINIMCNMSVDCDCCSVAEDPCIKDIGILASLDPVAIDQACIDLVKKSNDEGKAHFLERVESRHGTHTIDAAEELGIGSKDYELIEL